MRPIAATFDIKSEQKSSHAPISENLKSFATDLRGGGAFPWKPTLADKIRQWFISEKLQLAAQVAVAQIWASSFTFVRQDPALPERNNYVLEINGERPWSYAHYGDLS